MSPACPTNDRHAAQLAGGDGPSRHLQPHHHPHTPYPSPRHAAKLAEEMRTRNERKRMAEERGRVRHEMQYQQKMSNLRLSAARRKEAKLNEQLASSKHEMMQKRLQLAKSVDEKGRLNEQVPSPAISLRACI